jgi:HEAT repeat protein
MKRNRAIALVVLSGVIAVATFFALRPREPVYQGKQLSEWLRDFDNGRGSPGYSGAEEGVRAMGTDCLPILMCELRAQDSPLLEKLVRLAGRQHWLKVSYTQRGTRRARAVSAFHALGQRAIPALIQMLVPGESDRFESHYRDVGSALHAVGPSAAKAVSQLLTNRNTLVRDRAMDILSGFRTDDVREAIPGLMLCIKTDNELSFRNQAALCLEQIAHGDSDILVPIYIARLEDPNRYPRLNAACSLGKLGDRAIASVPALLSALNDPNARVRLEAMSALKLVDPEAAAKAGLK